MVVGLFLVSLLSSLHSLHYYPRPYKAFFFYIFYLLLYIGLGVIVLARLLGMTWFASIVSAQVATIAVYAHFFRGISFHSVGTVITPQTLYLNMLGYVLIVLFAMLGEKSTRVNLIIVLVLPLLILLGLSSFLSHFSVLGVSLLPFGLAALFLNLSKNVLKWKLLGIVFLSLFLWEIFPYIAASADYTSRSFFSTEIVGGIQDRTYVGILFHRVSSFVLCLGLTVGFILAFRFAPPKVRIFSVFGFLHIIIMSFLDLLYLFGGINWVKYPLIHYLEQPAYPIYVMIAVAGFYYYVTTINSVERQKEKSTFTHIQNFLSSLKSNGIACYAVILIIPLIFWTTKIDNVWNFSSVFKQNMYASMRQNTFEPDSFTSFVASKLELIPGSHFRGLIASVYKAKLTDNLVHSPYWATHWEKFSIPSLEEYSHTMTPQLYFFTTRLLFPSLPKFHNRNNVKVLSPNVRILSLLGVKLIATDYKLNDPNVKFLMHGPKNANWGGNDILLYEVKNPNLGNYSPLEIEISTSGQEIVNKIKDDNFEPQKQVILSRGIDGIGNLNSAQESEMIYERGVKVHVKARSKGWSMLVLPLQYSNCLVAETSSDNVQSPLLVRANLIQTAVVFKNQLDARISFDLGFFNASCRKKDLEDMRHLGLQSNQEDIYLPQYHPYAIR